MTSNFKTHLFIALCFCFIALETAQAEPELDPGTPVSAPKSTQEVFQAGLTAYQNKNFKEAEAAFDSVLKTLPDNAAALTNLGLAAFQSGRKPWAIAYFRKALAISPGLLHAREGLAYALSQTEVKELPRQIETYEIIREKLLSPVSEYAYFWILNICVLLFGWSLLNYLGQRKKAEENELSYPSVPWVSVVSGTLTLAVFSLAFLKVYDLQTPRATIVEDKVSVQSAPGDSQLGLFDIYGGLEVIVRAQSGEWAQVTYPGAMTGWIKKSSMLITSGGKLE